MTPTEARACSLSPEAAALLADLYARQRLSGRAHDRALRLAQTLADLAEAGSATGAWETPDDGLWAALQALPTKQRQAVAYHHVAGMRHDGR